MRPRRAVKNRLVDVHNGGGRTSNTRALPRGDWSRQRNLRPISDEITGGIDSQTQSASLRLVQTYMSRPEWKNTVPLTMSVFQIP